MLLTRLRPTRLATTRFPMSTATTHKPAVALLARLRKDHDGVPLALAKTALAETGNDYAAAVAWLARHAALRGAAKAAKVEARHARDGLVGVVDLPLGAAMVEVNAETDFVARADLFKDLVRRTALSAHFVASLDKKDGFAVTTTHLAMPAFYQAPLLPDAQTNNNDTTNCSTSIGDRIAECIGTLGEKIVLRRACTVTTPDPTTHVAGAYVHGDKAMRAAGLGRLGAIAVLAQEENSTKLTPHHARLAQQIAQVIVGFHPPTVRELLHAPFVAKTPFFEEGDGTEEVTVAKVLTAAKVHVHDFVRFEVGEGMEAVETTDFAEEVRKQAGL